MRPSRNNTPRSSTCSSCSGRRMSSSAGANSSRRSGTARTRRSPKRSAQRRHSTIFSRATTTRTSTAASMCRSQRGRPTRPPSWRRPRPSPRQSTRPANRRSKPSPYRPTLTGCRRHTMLPQRPARVAPGPEPRGALLPRRRTALALYACANDQPDCAEFLLSRAAHCLNLADSNGDTPLHAAVSAGSLRCTKILLSHAAHSEAANALGMKPLHLAQNRGCLEGARSPAPLYHARNTSPSEPTLSRRVFSASARRREHGCRGQPQADTALCRERDESRGLRRLLDRRARERGGDASFRPSRRYAASRSRVQRSGGVRAVAAPVGMDPNVRNRKGSGHRARGKARAPWL